MIKNILKGIGIIILAILQLAVISKISILGIAPNLILIIAVALMLRSRPYDAFLIILIGGTILDIGSSLKFGILIIIYLVILILIYLLINRISLIPNYFFSLLVFIGAFLFLNTITSLVYSGSLHWEILSDSAVNSLWGILILLLIQRFISERKEITYSARALARGVSLKWRRG